MSDEKSTGSVKKVLFVTMYTPTQKIGLDYSDPYMDIYDEVPPFAVDEETGEILNKTARPIIKVVGRRNIDEYIQSQADSCDIYKILEKYAMSGDSSLINLKQGYVGDICNIPDNINDFNDYLNRNIDGLETLDNEIARAILDENKSIEDIQGLVTTKVQAIRKANEEAKAKNITKVEVVNKEEGAK